MVLTVLFSLGAQAEPDTSPEDSQNLTIKVHEIGREFLIPEAFWEKADIKDGDHVTFANIGAHFREKTEGVLNKPDIDVSFPLGGGVLDLDLLSSKNKTGSYYLSFILPPPSDEETREVYYLSNGRRRKYETLTAGSGCRHLLKLNSKFLEKTEKEPLLLTNYKHLDVTMLAGTFIFVSRQKKNVFLSQITMTSSSLPELLCEHKENHD